MIHLIAVFGERRELSSNSEVNEVTNAKGI